MRIDLTIMCNVYWPIMTLLNKFVRSLLVQLF